jgi:hypothetical protein
MRVISLVAMSTAAAGCTTAPNFGPPRVKLAEVRRLTSRVQFLSTRHIVVMGGHSLVQEKFVRNVTGGK